MAGAGFIPNARDLIIDPTSGTFTEIGRILIRTLSSAASALAPIDGQYLTATATSGLTNERNLGALATGYLVLTTAIGIATPSTVAAIPQADVTGLVAALAALTAALGVITSGTYLPTITGVANVAASSVDVFQYLRVGNTVTASGRVIVDPTAAVDTQLAISLPVPSNFANLFDCAGVGACPSVAGQSGIIFGDFVNDRAVLEWLAVDLASRPMYVQFTYRVNP